MADYAECEPSARLRRGVGGVVPIPVGEAVEVTPV